MASLVPQYETRWERNNLKTFTTLFTVVLVAFTVALFIASWSVNGVANDLEDECISVAVHYQRTFDIPSVGLTRCAEADDRNRLVAGLLVAGSTTGIAAIGLGVTARMMDDYRPARGSRL